MSTPTNHWKLGLFVVLGLASCGGAFVYFGGRSLQKESVAYVTFFDESVQGLDVGSPVKFRGVSIGNVADIALAGDKRHVAVRYELGVTVLNSLGLAAEKEKGALTRLVIPSDLRVQLASSGLTGVKFVNMDFFDVKANPPLELPFPVPPNTIPAVASMMKSLENSVVQAVDRFPELTHQLQLVLESVSTLVGELQGAGLPAKLSEAVAVLTRVMGRIEGALAALEPGALSREAQTTLKGLSTVLTSLGQVLARVDGERGLAVSVQRTSEALGSLAQDANHVGPDLEEALKAVQSAARSVQRLADALDNDPDMLLKGRAKRVAR
jgi:paraquat-inducible protein B